MLGSKLVVVVGTRVVVVVDGEGAVVGVGAVVGATGTVGRNVSWAGMVAGLALAGELDSDDEGDAAKDPEVVSFGSSLVVAAVPVMPGDAVRPLR